MGIHLDRLNVLVKKRSIFGWVMWALALGWKRLGDWQNVEWLQQHLLPHAWPKAMLHPDYVTIALIIGGFAWFTIIILWPKKADVIGPAPATDGFYIELRFNLIYPKKGDLPFQLLEGKFKAEGRNPEEIRTDCDVLFELYAVNQGEKSLYIKDFSAWLEIEKQWCKLLLENNFYADDVWDGSVQYGLERPQEGEFGEWPEELPSLLLKKNAAVSSHEPIEGWLRFTAVDVNPRHQYPVRVAIIDSLGREHHIDKVELKNRKIGLRGRTKH
jgi:hypothetical protein